MNNFEFGENQEVGFKKDIILDETLTSSHLFFDTRPTLVNSCNIGFKVIKNM